MATFWMGAKFVTLKIKNNIPPYRGGSGGSLGGSGGSLRRVGRVTRRVTVGVYVILGK